MRVEYLLIGAGQAGLVLKRFLESKSAVLLDPHPGAYKIGESVVPEQFAHPVMQALVPKVRTLPSYAPKYGTTFISADSVASFPLPACEADLSMHVARNELESLMASEWAIDIVRERVLEIDLSRKLVRTDQQCYEVEKQIIDCSGPSMVVATALGEVSHLWPVYASWSYFDIRSNCDEKFWNAIRSSGKQYLRYDAPRRSVLPAREEIEGWSPSRTTILTRLSHGIWTWQIPLFNSTMLSVGAVSRHRPIGRDELIDIALKECAPNYQLEPRIYDNSSNYNRIYSREGFARRAKKAAALDYILLADAFAFADPVYSVGTALAVNKAIELAAILNGEGFDKRRLAAYCEAAELLLERAVKAFDFWYSGEVLSDDAAAAEVRDNFLIGSAFQVRAAYAYGGMINDASLGHQSARKEIRDMAGQRRKQEELRRFSGSLLGVDAQDALLGWTLSDVNARGDTFLFQWEMTGMPRLTVEAVVGSTSGKAFKQAGSIALSYRHLNTGPYPFHAGVGALIDAMAERMSRLQHEWLDLQRQYEMNPAE